MKGNPSAAGEYVARHLFRWFVLPVSEWSVWDRQGDFWLLSAYVDGRPARETDRLIDQASRFARRLVIDNWLNLGEFSLEHIIVTDNSDPAPFFFIDLELVGPVQRPPRTLGVSFLPEIVEATPMPAVDQWIEAAWQLPDTAIADLVASAARFWPEVERWLKPLCERRNSLVALCEKAMNAASWQSSLDRAPKAWSCS